MLAIKYTLNIFLISVYVSSVFQHDICYVKMGVLNNWKRLFLSVTYSSFTRAGVRHLFILIPVLYIHEVTTKYSREKIVHPRNTHEKKFWTHKNTHEKKFGPTKHPREKTLDPQNTHEKKFGPTKYKKKFWTHDIPTRQILYPRRHGVVRPTEFRICLVVLSILSYQLLFPYFHISCSFHTFILSVHMYRMN